jgi:hypothetical protein
MALFDEIDKSQISELFETKKVEKIDPEGFESNTKSVEFLEPSSQDFTTKEGTAEIPKSAEFKSKDGEYVTPEIPEIVTKSAEFNPGQEPDQEPKNVVSDDPEGFVAQTNYPIYETSEGFTPDDKLVKFENPTEYDVITDPVVKVDGSGYSAETRKAVFEEEVPQEFKTPDGISVPINFTSGETAQVKSNSPAPILSRVKEVAADTPDGYQADTELVKSEPAPGSNKTRASVVAENPTGFDANTPEVKYTDPIGYSSRYDYYTEGESSMKGLNKINPKLTTQPYEVKPAEVNFEIADQSLKKEFYDYLSRVLRGDTNLDNYNFHSWKGLIDQISSNFNGTGIRDAFTEGSRVYQNFSDLFSAWKKGGFKGLLTEYLSQSNELTPTPVQSDAIVPAINRFVDSLPIIGLFTKQKYSLDLNQRTYAHEAVYNKAVDYQKEALKMYEGGMFGIYWYAKFYSNHGIPTDKQEIILGKMSGNPNYSRPDYRIFDGFTDYLKVIGDAADESARATYVNLTDFTSSDPNKIPFKKVFELSRPTIDIDNNSKRARVNLSKKKSVVWRENKSGLDEELKYTIGNTDNPTRQEKVKFDTVYRPDQISPKYNAKLGTTDGLNISRITSGKEYQDSGTKSKNKMFRGWTEYEIETLGGVTKTNAGAIYVDPQQWDELTHIQAGKRIDNLADYENYRLSLTDQLNDLSNQEQHYGDIYYGYYPYKWSQVFSNFEISSNGNWNVALSEFTGSLSEYSMFVPKNRPTYGKWHYMPIISYEYMDKDLNSTSIPVSESLNLQIPSTMAFVGTLQLTFIDDRFDRIFNWFTAYTNSIYGFFDTYVKPYKNCCLRCVIDILDWDRTILKRMKYAIVPTHFTQQYIGEADHSYKTVSITFGVVGEINSTNWKPQ